MAMSEYLQADDPGLVWKVGSSRRLGGAIEVHVRHPESGAVGWSLGKDEDAAREKALVRLNSMRANPEMWNLPPGLTIR